MTTLILHKDGAYNIYSTVSDNCLYGKALTLDDLKEKIIIHYGEFGMLELPRRLERAHATGCSSIHNETLEDCIQCNRAGPNETELTEEEFIHRYLTLPNDTK